MLFPLISQSFQPSAVATAGDRVCCAVIFNLNQWRSSSRNKDLDPGSCPDDTTVREGSADNVEVAVQGAEAPGEWGRVMHPHLGWGLCALCFISVLPQIFLGPHGPSLGRHFLGTDPMCWVELCVWKLDSCPSCEAPLCEPGLAPKVVYGNCARTAAGALKKHYKQLQESLYKNLTEDKTLQLLFKLDFYPILAFHPSFCTHCYEGIVSYLLLISRDVHAMSEEQSWLC